METKQINTELAANLVFSELSFTKPAAQEDMEQGIDAWLGGIPFAWRRRRISLKQYGEISIRRTVASGGRTEYHKLLDGSFKAQVYVFQFTDAVVICLTQDIIVFLKTNMGYIKSNKDEITSAYYIPIKSISCLIIDKVLPIAIRETKK